MAFWATDTITQRLLIAAGVIKTPVTAPLTAPRFFNEQTGSYQSTPYGPMNVTLRQPVARRPTVKPSPEFFGQEAEGIQSGGDSSSVGLGEPGATGQSTEGLTAAEMVGAVFSGLATGLSMMSVQMAAIGAPVGAAAKGIIGLAQHAFGYAGRGLSIEQGQVAGPLSPEQAFAEANPITAKVFSFLGIPIAPEPTIAQRESQEQLQHSLNVAASLGITNAANQGFAFSGVPSGYVSIFGTELTTPASFGRGVDPDPDVSPDDPDAAPDAPDADAPDADADAGPGDGPSDGGAGAGGTGDGSGDGGGGDGE